MHRPTTLHAHAATGLGRLPDARLGAPAGSRLDELSRVALRQLGRTNIQLSPLGLGCWQFSQRRGLLGRFWEMVDDATVRQTVSTALRWGINWFDTAEVYGGGRSESCLARALEALGTLQKDVVIATKWWPLLRGAGSIPASARASQTRLNPYPIGLYMIHQPWSYSGFRAQVDGMARLAEDGRIGAVGVSNFNARAMRRADEMLRRRGLVLAANQVKFNLLDRRIETNGVLEAARDLGVTLIAYSPLEHGLLSGRYHSGALNARTKPGPRKFMGSFQARGLRRSRALVEELGRLAESFEVTPAAVALNWIIHRHGQVMLAIPGATRPKQVEANAAALRFRLTAEQLALLDDLASLAS